jgi:hypothetical protein
MALFSDMSMPLVSAFTLFAVPCVMTFRWYRQIARYRIDAPAGASRADGESDYWALTLIRPSNYSPEGQRLLRHFLFWAALWHIAVISDVVILGLPTRSPGIVISPYVESCTSGLTRALARTPEARAPFRKALGPRTGSNGLPERANAEARRRSVACAEVSVGESVATLEDDATVACDERRDAPVGRTVRRYFPRLAQQFLIHRPSTRDERSDHTATPL